jgi:hypothetical protein
MTEARQVGAAVLLLDGRVSVRLPGPIAAVEVGGGVVAVLTRWLGPVRHGGLRRVRTDNLYAFDESGRRLWRVRAAVRASRALLLTGFVEDGEAFTLHEANGWLVRVDPSTGLVVKTDFIA